MNAIYKDETLVLSDFLKRAENQFEKSSDRFCQHSLTEHWKDLRERKKVLESLAFKKIERNASTLYCHFLFRLEKDSNGLLSFLSSTFYSYTFQILKEDTDFYEIP